MAGPWEDYSSNPWEDFKRKDEPDSFLGKIGKAGVDTTLAAASALGAAPIAGLAGIVGSLGGTDQGADWVNKVQNALSYEPQTGYGKAVMAIPNAIGSMVAKGGEKAGSSIADAGYPMIGAGVNAAIQAAPAMLPLALRGGAAAVGRGLQGETVGAQRWMQSALKPNAEARRTGKSGEAAQTLLDEGVNVSPGGRDALTARIDPLDQQITDIIQNSTATIPKDAAATRMIGTLNDALQQGSGYATDVPAVTRAYQSFLDHPLMPSNDVPIQTAQTIKRGIYRSLGDRAYGELGSADVNAQKAQARGLAEEIAQAEPAAASINAEMGPLINARNMVADRVSRSGNTNPVGLGILNPKTLPLWLIERSDLGKSLIARLLNSAGNAMPAVGTAGQFTGVATSGEAAKKRALAALLSGNQ